MALKVIDPTFLSFDRWASALTEDNRDKVDFPVTPPLDVDWKNWASELSRYNNLYPSPYYMQGWKDWAKIIYELEIV